MKPPIITLAPSGTSAAAAAAEIARRIAISAPPGGTAEMPDLALFTMPPRQFLAGPACSAQSMVERWGVSDILGRMLAGVLQGQAAQVQTRGGLGGLLGQLLGDGEAPLAGLGGVAERLRQAGLGSQVESWIGLGANEALAPEAVTAAFGRDEVESLARQTGMSGQGLAGMLASLLPVVIDAMTPQGRLPQDAAELPQGAGMQALLRALGSSGGGGGFGALAGLLGRRG